MLRYNAAIPTKFMPAPGYSAYVAPEKYAQIAWVLGLGGHGEERARERLFARVDSCCRPWACRAPWPTLGIDPEEFRAAIDELAMAAFRDPSLRTNPRMPLVVELRQLLAAVAAPA